MKTFKKTLCLVLALVMVVGMFAVGSSAVFTDDDKIQYEIPVGVMVGMGIINGYEDGSFQPAKTVNRAEAAKMICYALIGSKAADGLVSAEKPFADVNADDWYAPYVSYLKAKNVIGGYDDGLFHGNYPVTGLQLAKMLLAAVGYGQKGEYDGAGFGTNTYVDALSKGTKSIFNGTKATDLTAAATREEAALYIYNAMCYVDQVTFSAGSEILGIAPAYTLKSSTMAAERFGYEEDNKAVDEIIETVSKNTTKTSKFYNKLVATTASGYQFVVDSYDMVGHKGDVYYRESDVKTDSADFTTVYLFDQHTYTVDTTGYTAANGKWTALAKTVDLKVTSGALVDDAKNKVDSGVIYTNYAHAAAGTATLIVAGNILIVEENENGLDAVVGIQKNDIQDVKVKVAYNKSKKTTTATFNGAYADAKFYDNTDNNGKLTTNDDATGIDWASFVSADTVTKSVYYRVQLIDGKYNFSEIPSVTGAITMINTTSKKLTINGETYGFVDTESTLMNASPIDIAAIAVKGNTNTYKAFVGVDGKINYIEVVTGTETAAVGDIAFAAAYTAVGKAATGSNAFDASDKSYDFYVQLAFADGTYGTYKLAKLNGKTVVDDTAAKKLSGFSALGTPLAGYEFFEYNYAATATSVTDAANGLDDSDLAAIKGAVYAKLNDAGEAEVYTSAGAAAISSKLAIKQGTKATFAIADVDKGSTSIVTTLADTSTVNAYIDSTSAFIYMNNAGASNFKTVMKSGTHALATNPGVTATIVYKTDANTSISTIVAAFVGNFAFTATTDTKDIYYLAAYTGETAEGHNYTAYKVGSDTAETITVAAYVTAATSTLYKVNTTTDASGKETKTFADSTKDLSTLVLTNVAFTVNGVTYVKGNDETPTEIDVPVASTTAFVNTVEDGVATSLDLLISGDTVLYILDDVSTSATYNQALSIIVTAEAAR